MLFSLRRQRSYVRIVSGAPYFNNLRLRFPLALVLYEKNTKTPLRKSTKNATFRVVFLRPRKPARAPTQRAALTVSEAVHISNQIAQAESVAALERKREGGRKGKPGKSASDDALFQKPKDRAADRVAKRLGMSEATLRRADHVVKNAVRPICDQVYE